MPATKRVGGLLDLLRTALIFGLAALGIYTSMQWFGQSTSLDMNAAQDKAYSVVNGYCHRDGAAACMPELSDVDIVGSKHGLQNTGWRFLYTLSAKQQMQVEVDDRGNVQLASAQPR